jgi:hypothetical protein
VGERALPRASAAGLDWFSFFLADIQTGFGPFVAIYLTAHQWARSILAWFSRLGGWLQSRVRSPAALWSIVRLPVAYTPR